MRMLVLAALALAACNRAVASPPAPAPAPLAALAVATSRPLVINEVSAAGRADDWFEIVNTSGARLDLSDFAYVDARHRSRPRAFPGFVLEPGERHVQPVSRAVDGFQLGARETLLVVRADDGAVVDRVAWGRGTSPRNGSYARIPDTTGGFATLTRDSRDAPNRP